MNSPTIDKMLETMSDQTLVAFITDVQMLGKGAEAFQLRLEEFAYEALAERVGEQTADAMIQDRIDNDCTA